MSRDPEHIDAPVPPPFEELRSLVNRIGDQGHRQSIRGVGGSGQVVVECQADGRTTVKIHPSLIGATADRGALEAAVAEAVAELVGVVSASEALSAARDVSTTQSSLKLDAMRGELETNLSGIEKTFADLARRLPRRS